MSLTLHTLTHPRGTKRKRKVIGRGNASGHGTYAGRGVKGQKARTGGSKGLKRKGLRMMLLRIPKTRGFTGRPNETVVLNLDALSKTVREGMQVDAALLKTMGLVGSRAKRVKILGDGEWPHKGVAFTGLIFSQSARDKVIAAGSTIT